MNQPPRPKSHQVGIVVAMLATAVVAGITIGWLLSSNLPVQITQSPSFTNTQLPRRPATPAPASIQQAVVPSQAAIADLAVAPSATPLISATANNTPAISVTQEPATALLQHIAAAESALQTGELEAALDYGNGSRSSAQVRFDLGILENQPRLDFKTTYQSAGSTQTIHEITIGDRFWERHDDQSWSSIPAHKGLWDQIRFFLPRAEYAVNPHYSTQSDQAKLSWYDPTRDADITLTVDPNTAVPVMLERQTRGSGLLLVVTYRRWNMPVEILPPAGDLH